MEELILIGYEFLTVLVPVIITMIGFCLLYKKRNLTNTGWHILLLFIFAIYIFGVFYFTGVGTIFDMKFYGLEYHADRVNLVPFSDTNIDYMGYGLNIVLFVPLGFLLPLVWQDFNRISYVFISGLLLSLMVELSQLLNIRSTDIDDLILNTVGAIFGIIIFRLYSYITKRIGKSVNHVRERRAGFDDKLEVIIYILVMFLGHFFFYNGFGMAKWLFGF